MKKILIILLLVLSIFLSGCAEDIFKETTEANEGKIILTLGEDYASFIDEELPSFTFEFEGTLYTDINRDPFQVLFYNNDGKTLSNAISKLLEQYKDRTHIELVSKNTGVTAALFPKMNEYGAVYNEEYTPDDYCEYNETAFIDLENGLKLKIDYRRFLYNGENYYTWPYGGAATQPFRMALIYSLMVIEDSLTNKIVLTTLPTRIAPTIYNNIVGGSRIKLSNLINGSKYVNNKDSIFYSYGYPVMEELEDKEQQLLDSQQYIIDYYVNNWEGQYLEEEYTIIEDEESVNKVHKFLSYKYNGNAFQIEFFEETFVMKYIGKAA